MITPTTSTKTTKSKGALKNNQSTKRTVFPIITNLMTNYIARTGGQKKKNILHQKELALRGKIGRNASKEKLQTSPEKVRKAQLGVIKALIHEAQPCRSEDKASSEKALLNLDEANGHWQNISAQEIIEIYSEETNDTPIIDRKKWWDSRPR